MKNKKIKLEHSSRGSKIKLGSGKWNDSMLEARKTL